jgi:hypothetical protein
MNRDAIALGGCFGSAIAAMVIALVMHRVPPAVLFYIACVWWLAPQWSTGRLPWLRKTLPDIHRELHARRAPISGAARFMIWGSALFAGLAVIVMFRT